MVQDSSTTIVHIFHLVVNISLQNIIQIKCFVASQSILLTKRIHCLFNSAFFWWKMKFYTWFLFITGITRRTIRSWKFINHSLKQKVVILAIEGLQPATSVTINTFTGIFQGFCLIWTNSYLTNTSQQLLLTHK